MTDSTIVPVILSGGSGTRLWPVSRASLPKQLLPMVDDRTMLQATIDRLEGIQHLADPLVVCNEQHHFAVAHRLTGAGFAPRMILEPMGRNTAPAVAAAAFVLTQDGADPLMLVLPADHVIIDEPAFRTAVATAATHAARGKLVTFGIVPTHPETGYGYIERGQDVGNGAHAVDGFVEKPDFATAEGYLATGRFLWNSGMFLFSAERYLTELAEFEPEMLAATKAAVEDAQSRDGAALLDGPSFAACPANSIDYAVMERTNDAVVVPLDAGWNDVGSWPALFAITGQDASGNALRGDVVVHEVTNSYIRAESRLVTAIGLDETVVIETPDAVLVTPMAAAQDVKAIVDALKQAERSEAVQHPYADRSWGSVTLLATSEAYLVERHQIDPGHTSTPPAGGTRVEQWTVAVGRGSATVDGTTYELSPGDSLTVPATAVRSLSNPGSATLVVVVTATGSYLGDSSSP
jgi:mannose-1-phosphate guanylyltransferase/mannose-6-phosphate isomerase